MAGGAEFPSRSFLLFWRANAVSAFGMYITLLALQALVVLTLHGSATEVGWLSSARWLPYLVLGIVVGALVDRRPRQPVLVATDVIQAGLLATIPVLWWVHRLSFPVLLVIVLAYGATSVVNGAAAMSFLPRLVPREHLQRAHARGDGADAVAMSSGPALGGLLVSTLGAPLAVLVDAATYLYSAVTLSRIRVTEPPARAGTRARDLVAEIRDGLRWVYRGSGLTTLAVATHGWFVGNAVVAVVLAPYALLTLGLSAFQLGLVGAIGGIGAVVGAAVTTRVGLALGTGRTIIACHAVDVVGVLVMVAAGAASHSWVAFAVLAAGQGLYGLSLGMSNSHEMSYRQLITPDELQARTNTTLRSLNRAVMVVVAPVAGILADAWGIRPTLVAAAAVFAVVSCGLALSPFRLVRAPV
ncbi:MAG TPA: MFS transporter [Nocardioides sp.]|uniref:MFS transporter n=1 Tax=Nocardioides sp. TaxID=35761 RepID=UPI002E36419E|nr:MFS transporter [Nocardioides sp.]HEX5087675.1 MFS transporter [Nocardioides sp.]